MGFDPFRPCVWFPAATAAHAQPSAVPAGRDLQAALDAAQRDVRSSRRTYTNFILPNKATTAAWHTIRSARPTMCFALWRA